MLFEAVTLSVLGMVIASVPLSASFRRHAASDFARRTGAQVPAAQQHTLEARISRRTYAVGLSLLLCGAGLELWHRTTRGYLGEIESLGEISSWVTLGLAWSAGAAALAAVEIWRPGVPHDHGSRTARSSVPGLSDYLPRYIPLMTWMIASIGVLSVVVAAALSRSRWFDAGTVLGGGVPFAGAALVVLAVLTHLAVRRILDAPQPARDEDELYWQDAVRASTLSALYTPPALVGVFTVLVVARTLDDAASVTATSTGQVGPAWTTAVLVLGYIAVPVLLGVAAVVTIARGRDNERTRFRRRLWPAAGGVPGPRLGNA